MRDEISPDAEDTALRGRLDEFAARISMKLMEFEKQGASHGTERETVADRKLQHLNLAKEHNLVADLAADIEMLRLNLQRLLARIDKGH